MRVFHHRDAKLEDADEESSKLKVRRLITEEDGAENFWMRLFELEPGGYSPFHTHPWEHEVFILEGEGSVVAERGETKFSDGYVVFVAPHEKHQFKNTGSRTVKMICVVPKHK